MEHIIFHLLFKDFVNNLKSFIFEWMMMKLGDKMHITRPKNWDLIGIKLLEFLMKIPSSKMFYFYLFKFYIRIKRSIKKLINLNISH